MLDEERFRDCEPVMVACANCNAVSRFAGAYGEPSPASLTMVRALGVRELLSRAL